MKAEYVRQAMEKVSSPCTLVNLIARRVRQLGFGGGRLCRPLVADAAKLRAADIALREIIEGKMGWEMPEWVPLTRPVSKNISRR